MATKSLKNLAGTQLTALEKQIDDVAKFVADRISQDSTYTKIHQKLSNLKNAIQQNKLVVQVIGHDLEQVQTLHKLLAQSSLRDHFEINFEVLPDSSKSKSASDLPVLTLQNSDTPTYYELVDERSSKIGRGSKVQILLTDDFSLVSGCHAELQALPNNNWKIQDLNSRNGTYVNGTRIRDWQILEVGDQICLGSAARSAGSAVFMLEYPEPNIQSDLTEWLFDCNVVCLIVNLDHPVAHSVQRYIQNINQASVAKTFLIAVTPVNASPDLVKTNLAELEQWVSKQSNQPALELIPLFLQPIVHNAKATVLLPQAQPEFEQLCQALNSLEAPVEELLYQRLAAQLAHQLVAIETVLNHQQNTLTRKIQVGEIKLQQIAQDNIKEQVKKAIETVKKESDQFFKQVKSEIAQSKADFLSEHRKDGLPYRVKRFIQRLKTVTAIQGGLCHIHFQTKHETEDIHAVMNHLCQSELKNWAVDEWKRICTLYNADGLIGLLRSSYKTLSFSPDINLPVSLFQVPKGIDVEKILQISAVAVDYKGHYRQLTFRGYIYKRIKSEVITLLSTIALIGIPVFTLLGQAFDKAKYTPLIIPIAIIFMYFSYKQEMAIKLEEAVEKIQKELADHYQAFGKNLADRLAQHLMSVMELEDRRLRDTIDIANEQCAIYISELEKSQAQLKSQLEELKKNQQKKIEKDMADFQKLKHGLSTATRS